MYDVLDTTYVAILDVAHSMKRNHGKHVNVEMITLMFVTVECIQVNFTKNLGVET